MRKAARLPSGEMVARRSEPSVTSTSAVCLGVEYELGSVAEGKRADLILVRGDPSRDIRALGQIEWVLLDGRQFARSELLPNE